jgi:hypothetical protein
MESQFPLATRDELWRLQEEIKDLFATQGQHSERIMRLEKRRDEDMRLKNVWGSSPQFPGSLGNSAHQGKKRLTTFEDIVVLMRQQSPVSILRPRLLETSTQMRSLA